MPAPLFANKPGHCPYGHSLAPGKPQKIPCICDPAREAAEHGRGMGHLTLRCGACSAEDHRDTRFYEPPHQISHNRPLSGWATRPDALALRTRQLDAARSAATANSAGVGKGATVPNHGHGHVVAVGWPEARPGMRAANLRSLIRHLSEGTVQSKVRQPRPSLESIRASRCGSVDHYRVRSSSP